MAVFPAPAWRKSSYCEAGACVEVAAAAGAVLVRDSKVSEGAILSFSTVSWQAFAAGLRQGEFDRSR